MRSGGAELDYTPALTSPPVQLLYQGFTGVCHSSENDDRF